MKYIFIWMLAMQKIITLLLITTHLLYGIDVDTQYLKQQISYNQKDTSYRLILAKYYIQNYDYTQAQKYLNEIKKIDPNNHKATILQKKLHTLLELRKSLGDIELWDIEAIETTLKDLLQKHKYTQVINIYTELEKLHTPISQNSYLYIAKAYAKTGKLHRAKLLTKIKDFPNDDGYLSLGVDISLAKDDLENAKKLYNQMVENYPKSNYTKEAKEQITKVVNQKANSIAKDLNLNNSQKKLFDYIYLLRSNHQEKKALKALNKYIDKNPNNIEAKLLRAKIYYWDGNLKQAFHKIYNIRTTSSESKALYANILYEKGDYIHALVYLPEAAKNAKDDKERYNLEKRAAFAYLYLHKDKEANRILKRLIKENPNDKTIIALHKKNALQSLLNEAREYHKANDINKALKLYKKYYIQTKDLNIAKEIAEIYYFNNRYKDSLPYYSSYLKKNSNDNLIRFHFASAYEHDKDYQKSSVEFEKILKDQNSKLYYLAKYHYAHNLMQLQNEKDWLKARKTLKSLNTQLETTKDEDAKKLTKFVHPLLKAVLGPVRKPTYFKDIVLTEGAKKKLNPDEVFSADDLIHTTKTPTAALLLHINNQKPKPTLRVSSEYVNDSIIKYINYKMAIEDFLVSNGIRYSVQAQRFYLEHKNIKKYQGNGIYVSAKNHKMTFTIGLDKFKDFTALMQEINYHTTSGIHDINLNFYYKNALFNNYRSCMIDTKDSVLHAGIYDQIMLENLNYLDIQLDINAYNDDNINLSAYLNYPLFHIWKYGLEHKIEFNTNFEYNTKTDICYTPDKTYDASYLLYTPKYNFKNGSIALGVGSGYSFSNKESLYTYSFKGDYNINKVATFEINCQRIQNSISYADMDYCTLNVIQDW